MRREVLWALVMVVVLALVLVGITASGARSGSIEIFSPRPERTLIYTPYDLVVKHVGCGLVEPESFEAWLDPGMPDARNITGDFTRDDEEWVAYDLGLAAGTHTLWVGAKLEQGQGMMRCWWLRGSDSQEFTVYEPTCVRGRVLWLLGSLGAPEGPFAGARVELWTGEYPPGSGEGEFLASSIADDSGVFCLDHVPVAIDTPMYLHVRHKGPLAELPEEARETGARICEGGYLLSEVSIAHGRCEDGLCNVVPDLRVRCW